MGLALGVWAFLEEIWAVGRPPVSRQEVRLS